ncbi:MAG: hypothetical protein CM15mP111_2890 [Hyphomicrobiales bacterium]|nr:MAG: hypothetical protein CM15mP111_2890 [Hyphomicrobiales bacterium]
MGAHTDHNIKSNTSNVRQEGSEDEAKEKENHLLIDMANKGFQDKISKFGTAGKLYISFIKGRLIMNFQLFLIWIMLGIF